MADVTMMRRLYHCKADLKSQRYESIQQIDAKYIARMNQLLQQKSIIIKHIHQQYERQLGRVDIIIQSIENKLLNYNPRATSRTHTATMPHLETEHNIDNNSSCLEPEPETTEANEQHQNTRNAPNTSLNDPEKHASLGIDHDDDSRINLEPRLTSNAEQANTQYTVDKDDDMIHRIHTDTTERTIGSDSLQRPQPELEPIEANEQHHNTRNASNTPINDPETHESPVIEHEHDSRINLETLLTSNAEQDNLDDNSSVESDEGNISVDSDGSCSGTNAHHSHQKKTVSKIRSQPSKNMKWKRKQYPCTKCRYTARIKKNYDQHMRKHHKIHTFKYKCDQCEYSCQFVYQLQKHVKKHPKYKCDHCQYATKRKTDYNKHIKNHKYKCGRCAFSCKWRYELKRHSANHIGEKPYQCAKCKKRFLCESRLGAHVGKCKTVVICLKGWHMDRLAYTHSYNVMESVAHEEEKNASDDEEDIESLEDEIPSGVYVSNHQTNDGRSSDMQ
eukprot:38693_1